MSIKIILSECKPAATTISGWVRAIRNQKFIEVNDGSCVANLQVVTDKLDPDVTVGSSITVHGQLQVPLSGSEKIELAATEIKVIGKCDPSAYPIQTKNKPSLEELRDHANLRFRTNTFGAVFRIRSKLSYLIHEFFQQRDFVNLHTPILTASDAEGAGQTFNVTTIGRRETEESAHLFDSSFYKQDFFGQKAFLTVSGQLEAELAATALGKVYTFGPTFRAENSNTTRHLAEFWMVEPEVAFADLKQNINLAQNLFSYLTHKIVLSNKEDLEFLSARLEKEESSLPEKNRSKKTLMAKLLDAPTWPIAKVSYTDAVEIILKSAHYKKGKFKKSLSWGDDLSSEFEKYLTEVHFESPVFVTDYPKDIKAFYMRLNEDGKTVAAMDFLVPGIGEIIGGSQREERLDILEQRMLEMNVPIEELSWYLDTRRFGTVPHAGFGLGFERLVQYITGMSNIRDVIPFHRTPGSIKF